MFGTDLTNPLTGSHWLPCCEQTIKRKGGCRRLPQQSSLEEKVAWIREARADVVQSGTLWISPAGGICWHIGKKSDHMIQSQGLTDYRTQLFLQGWRRLGWANLRVKIKVGLWEIFVLRYLLNIQGEIWQAVRHMNLELSINTEFQSPTLGSSFSSF